MSQQWSQIWDKLHSQGKFCRIHGSFGKEFLMIHKVGNIRIFVLLIFGNKLDIVISRINCNSMHQDNCKLPKQNILLITISHLFTLPSLPITGKLGWVWWSHRNDIFKTGSYLSFLKMLEMWNRLAWNLDIEKFDSCSPGVGSKL